MNDVIRPSNENDELIDRVCRGTASIQEGQQLREYITDLQKRVDFAAAGLTVVERRRDQLRAERDALRGSHETLQPHQNLALARINHLARKGRFDEADAQLFRDAIVHRPGSVPHHHIWSVSGPPRDPDPEQVCDFGCGLKWKDRQEAEAHAQKASERRGTPEEEADWAEFGDCPRCWRCAAPVITIHGFAPGCIRNCPPSPQSEEV